MADSRHLAIAVEAARIGLSPMEEQIIWLSLNAVDKQIDALIKDNKEIRDPYEFN